MEGFIFFLIIVISIGATFACVWFMRDKTKAGLVLTAAVSLFVCFLTAFICLISTAIIGRYMPENPSPESAVIDPEASRKSQIEEQFSSWDGSHRKLEELIKSNMNDPASYEHVKTVYVDRGKFILVKTTFRGKNAFNATVINSVTAIADLNGDIIKILDDEK